jgi:hypothetical protein
LKQGPDHFGPPPTGCRRPPDRTKAYAVTRPGRHALCIIKTNKRNWLEVRTWHGLGMLCRALAWHRSQLPDGGAHPDYGNRCHCIWPRPDDLVRS